MSEDVGLWLPKTVNRSLRRYFDHRNRSESISAAVTEADDDASTVRWALND